MPTQLIIIQHTKEPRQTLFVDNADDNKSNWLVNVRQQNRK